MQGKDNRKARELNDIVRLIYIYGCFGRQEMINILNANAERLNHQYGLLDEVFKNNQFRIPRKGKNKKIVPDDKLLQSDMSELWNVYMEPEKRKEDNLRTARKHQYSIALELAAKYQEGFQLKDFQCCYDRKYPREDGEFKETGSCSRSSERSHRAALKELTELGLLKKYGHTYKAKYSLFPQLTETEAAELLCFLKYAVKLLYPALPGYYLYQALQEKGEKKYKEKNLNLYCKGYHAHVILDEGCYMELEEMLQKSNTDFRKIFFDYIDNDGSRLEIQKPAKKRKCEIFPYRFLHDMCYGRTFLVGYSLNNRKMSAYRLDLIKNPKSVPCVLQEEKPDMEQLYRETFHNTWAGGAAAKEMKRVRLEILEPEKVLLKIKREGVTENRKGYFLRDKNRRFYEILVSDPSDMKPWIMSMGKSVEVVSVTGAKSGKDYSDDMDELPEVIKRTLRKMQAQYG